MRRPVHVACPSPSRNCSPSASGRSPDHPRRRAASFTSRVRGRRRRTHRAPPGHPPAGPPGHPPSGATTHHIVGPVAIGGWTSRRLRRSPGTIDLATTLPSRCISRGHQDLLTAGLRDHPPDHPRRVVGAIHRTSPRRPRFGSARPLREHREARDPESKTEGKIKAWCHVGDKCWIGIMIFGVIGYGAGAT